LFNLNKGKRMIALQTVVACLRSAKKICVFTGAGISAESGIATFRDSQDEDGYWQRFRPEELASAAGFLANPSLVWGWYTWRCQQLEAAKPNAGHLAIAQLAQAVPQLSLVTQNVDDLHERAGSVNVQHLHGQINHAHCFDCGEVYPLGTQRQQPDVSDPPSCRRCGGLVRPSVVWFGECLSPAVLDGAQQCMNEADIIFVIGTSGLVSPACDMPYHAKKVRVAKPGDERLLLVQINPIPTALDPLMDINLYGTAVQVLPRLFSSIHARI
jgi:NAD-dependent deacetylase